MREIREFIIHCSDSDFGDAETIDRWHRERGWSGIGYHYVILNGVVAAHGEYDAKRDGEIQIGRLVDRQGAHCEGHNAHSVGICLIGRKHFTGQQLYKALPNLLMLWLATFPEMTTDSIRAHYEYNPGKTCPNIDIDLIREDLRRRIAVKKLEEKVREYEAKLSNRKDDD